MEHVNPPRAYLLQGTGVCVNQGSGLFPIPFEYTSSLLSGCLGSKQRVEVCPSFV